MHRPQYTLNASQSVIIAQYGTLAAIWLGASMSLSLSIIIEKLKIQQGRVANMRQTESDTRVDSKCAVCVIDDGISQLKLHAREPN